MSKSNPPVTNEKPSNNSPHSALTAVIEILNYQSSLEAGKFNPLPDFFSELANEIYSTKWKNYNHSYSAILPEIRIEADRIYLYSPLFLEKNLPDLSNLVFQLFVEFCNMLLAIALKHEIALRGIAGIDEVTKSKIYSGSVTRSKKKDTLMLGDMLKVFSFEEIFPEGIGEVFIPPVVISVYQSNILMRANHLLSEIKAVGIYWPEDILNYPAAEVSIYSDLLIETSINSRKMYAASWNNWVKKNPESFSEKDLSEVITSLANDSATDFAQYWDKFSKIS